MPPSPVPADPGWDEDLAWLDRDPVTAAEREAWLDRLCQLDDDPSDGPQEYWDPESCAPPPGQDELAAEELAGVAGAAADEMLALDAASTGRRGPGQAGSARVFPGVSDSRAAGFGVGLAWDVMPGCAQLAVAADAAVGGGSGDSFSGAADHELVGVVCAWDRVEAHAAARKLVAIAEVFRRNPEDGFEPEPGRMPAVVHEFTRDQLALTLGESRAAADWLLTVAWHLATRLGATLEALTDGEITRGKAELIVRLTHYLSDEEAKAVEAKILGRAGQLTPGGLRSALARAVMEVAPKTARERRQTAARFARVERWAEDSGNAALMGRELPPDEVLACDQRICWWAGELKKAGLDGGMDELRARAFLDLVLGKDSRPRDPQDAGNGPPGHRRRGAAASRHGARGRSRGRRSGRVRRAGHLHRAARHRRRAGRPARRAGRARPGRPLARPRPGQRRRAEPQDNLVRDGDRPARSRGRARMRPARTQGSRETGRTRAAGRGREPGRGRVQLHPGQPGRAARRVRHVWRLRVPGSGPDLIVAIDSLGTDPCQHQYQARGHDPGVRLRHLSQIRHATCTSPVCRRPAAQCDFEHNTPYEAGGRTCLCNRGPPCKT